MLFRSAKDIVGKIIMTACEDKRKLYYSVRVSITVIIVAWIYMQLEEFGKSIISAAATVLPTAELHVGKSDRSRTSYAFLLLLLPSLEFNRALVY